MVIIAKKVSDAEKPGKDAVAVAGKPKFNIGMVGHVDHGKTTLTEALSGKWTDTHSEEIKRGITIRLGYADFSIYRCPGCREPDCYSTKEICAKCGKAGELLRIVSIVDAPGHESLMATMLSGSAIIDGALLLIAANEPCPQPQTREHLVALEIVGIKNIVVVQNKIDLVSEEAARENYAGIKAFLKGTPYESAAIIPVSAQRKVNIDALLQAMQDRMPDPERDKGKEPLMLIARSFDVNRPGSDYAGLVGGVLGGTLKRGSLRIGDEVELMPGRIVEKHGKDVWQPVTTTVAKLKCGSADAEEVFPGGSIGVMTGLDPSITKSDAFAGNLLGAPGKLPPVWGALELEVHLLERVVGARDELVVEPVKLNESLMLNVNSAATVGVVTALKKGGMSCSLRIPVCAEKGARVTISRLLGSRWRLIGYGIIRG